MFFYDINYYGCRFAVALKDMNVWVMNVVPLDSPDTLIIDFFCLFVVVEHNFVIVVVNI